MRPVSMFVGIASIVLALMMGSLAGCALNARAVDEAYEKGYAEGVASMEGALVAAESAYQRGYEDGLADADAKSDADLCQSCYGLGFSEGYRAGLAAAS